MKTVFLFVLTIYSFSSIQAKLYQTINDGQFFDSSIWDRNEVPKFLKGDSIILYHHIVVFGKSDTFGSNNKVSIIIEKTGTFCLDKDYTVFNINLLNLGVFYTKKARFLNCYILIYSSQFSSDTLFYDQSYNEVKYRGRIVVSNLLKIKCPELEIDTNSYSVKCPKLSFVYQESFINDTTSKITFLNSQEAVMKVKIKDSTYTVLHGNYIYLKHLLEEEIPIKILATDNCDRAKEFNFKLSYAKTSSSSIHSGVMENFDFIVKKTSQYSWVFESKNSSNNNYHIYDINGRSIQKGQFLNSVEINLKDQSSGMYFIEINNTQRQNKYFSKLVLED